MGDNEIVERFARLFQGNVHRYGTEDGGSQTITYGSWGGLCADHLFGDSEPIGAYPIDPRTGRCRWGCVDFDEGDEASWVHAIRVQYFLFLNNVFSWVERSRSKGYHVWVFTQPNMRPEVTRYALLYACEFVGAPTKEINPKQASLEDGQIGNYVRLPYPAALATVWLKQGQRRVMVERDSGLDIPIGQFVTVAYDTLAEKADLEALARRYKPPVEHEHKTYATPPEIETNDLTVRMPPNAYRLYNQGPSNADRSSTLVRFAGELARCHCFDESEVYALVVSADERWGKYYSRNDADLRIGDIVSKVFNERDEAY